jgi:hypothetical protein
LDHAVQSNLLQLVSIDLVWCANKDYFLFVSYPDLEHKHLVLRSLDICFAGHHILWDAHWV